MSKRQQHGALRTEVLKRKLNQLQRKGISNRRVESVLRECGVSVRLREYVSGETRPSITVLSLLCWLCDSAPSELVTPGRCPAPIRQLLKEAGE